jgi:hypothetical protein
MHPSGSLATFKSRCNDWLMYRPDPMIPSKPGAQDTQAMDNRVKWLEALYVHDGRNNPDHPFHHTYTGLVRQYSGVPMSDLCDND